MKIKEVCKLTGLTDRAVRFYIENNLLFPNYKENYSGRKTYDFSEDNIETLNKITVYRKFGFSVETIKQVLSNQIDLQTAAKQSLEELQNEIEVLTGSIELCKEVLKNNETNQSLNPEYYLREISNKEKQGNKFADSIREYAKFEEDIFFITMKNSYFGKALKKIKDKHGYTWLAIAFIIVSIISGLMGIFVWQYGFFVGFIRPLIIFGIISILVLPLYLFGEKYPKFTMIWLKAVLVVLCIVVLGLLLFAAYIVFDIFNHTDVYTGAII